MSDDRVDPPGPEPAPDWAGRCLSEFSSMSRCDAPVEERRSAGRDAVSGAALIRPEFGVAVACTLVDRSAGGARLKVLSVLGIPDDFILSVGSERMRARVAWRSPSEIGVALSPV